MSSSSPTFDKCFYGTVTIGERGQVVIPAAARQALSYGPGDKLLVMSHPAHPGVMMFKIDALQSFIDLMSEELERAKRHLAESAGTGEGG
jgi:AbrB family looped-hinge helix DNA binding protein